MIAFVIDDFFKTKKGTILLGAITDGKNTRYSGKLVSEDGISMKVTTLSGKRIDQNPKHTAFEVLSVLAGNVDHGIIGKTFYEA